MSKAHKPDGFTLVEMLLVGVMLAAMGLTITATFAGGLKIFNRMESHTAIKADVLLSLEKMERDLRNTFPFKGMDFRGEAKRMTFPSILGTTSAKGRVEESLGSVSYYRDDSLKTRRLFREEKKYALAVQKDNPTHGDIMDLVPIEDVNFQYFSYDAESKAYSWIDAWDRSEASEKQKEDNGAAQNSAALEDRPEHLPLGVKIKISYRDGGKILTLTRTVFIKTAVSLNLAKAKAISEKHDSRGTSREP